MLFMYALLSSKQKIQWYSLVLRTVKYTLQMKWALKTVIRTKSMNEYNDFLLDQMCSAATSI